jgi:hypothetical protein
MGELIMLFIGEGVLSIVVGLDSRRSTQDHICQLTHTCCFIQEAKMPLPQECLSLAGGEHLLEGSSHTPKVNCAILESEFLCSIIMQKSGGHLLSAAATDHSGGTSDLTYGESIMSHMYSTDIVCLVFGIHILYLIHIMCMYCVQLLALARTIPLNVCTTRRFLSDFNTQPHNPDHHALRQESGLGFIWQAAHLPLLAFVLIFGVSIKSILYINNHWEAGEIDLLHYLFVALPTMLLFWQIEFIKISHSGMYDSCTLAYFFI